MKDKKFWIIIGGLMVVFLGLLFWPTGRKTNTGVKTVDKKIIEPSADFQMDTPQKIDWSTTIQKDYLNADVLLVDQKVVDVNKKIAIKNIVSGNDNASSNVFDFDDNRSSFEFSKNISEKKQIQKGGLKAEDIKVKFTDMENKLKEQTSWEPVIESFGYKQFLKPWWVSATKDSFDAIEVVANYSYKGTPIRTFHGFMVDSVFFTNGDLVKTTNQLPYEKIVKAESKKLLSLSDLKNTDSGSFKVWAVDGGADYELSGEPQTINQVLVTDYELGYIYDLKTSVVWPFYFVKGTASLTTGQAKVTLIISAVKE